MQMRRHRNLEDDRITIANNSKKKKGLLSI